MDQSTNDSILFVDFYASGHHVEYVCHIVRYLSQVETASTYYFLVPEDFKAMADELLFDIDLPTEKFNFLRCEEYIKTDNLGADLSSYSQRITAVRSLVRDLAISRCVFMFLDNPLQVALSVLGRLDVGCKFQGLFFNPYGGFGSRFMRAKQLVQRYIQRQLLVANSQCENLFIVGPHGLDSRLNRQHFSRKFISLPDPILDIRCLTRRPDHVELPDVEGSRTSFLLFGSLSARKGIFTILDALQLVPARSLHNIEIVFAGQISDAGVAEFERRVADITLKTDVKICVIFKMLSYGALSKLISRSDFILMPYIDSQASSGVLGHAANFDTSVITAVRGVVGVDVVNHSLGVLLPKNTASDFAEALCRLSDDRVEISSESNEIYASEARRRYVESRSAVVFAEKLLGTWS